MRLCLITYYSSKKVWGEAFYPLHKKLSFSLRIFSVHVTKSAGICGFAHIHWRNLSLKTSFFVQWQLGLYKRILDSSCHLTLLIYTKHKNNKMKSWTGPTSSCPCVTQIFPEIIEGIPQNDWNHSPKCLATSTRIQNFLVLYIAWDIMKEMIGKKQKLKKESTSKSCYWGKRNIWQGNNSKTI